jgi:hypothetical protein
VPHRLAAGKPAAVLLNSAVILVPLVKPRALSDTSTPHHMMRVLSREKAGLRRDAVRSQVIDVLEHG